jgi:hypothetical protein
VDFEMGEKQLPPGEAGGAAFHGYCAILDSPEQTAH